MRQLPHHLHRSPRPPERLGNATLGMVAALIACGTCMLPAPARAAAATSDTPSPLQDRLAIAKVYYLHQSGEKPPFERAVPTTAVERNLALDELKESVLAKVYGVRIQTSQVESEIKRIQTTTLAPEMLAELWQAVGRSSDRFGRAIAKPLIVDRELRKRYDNDPHQHQPIRLKLEEFRKQLLARTAAERHQILRSQAGATEVSYALLEAPRDKRGIERIPAVTEIFIGELHPDLAHVLTTQLRQPGDVSPVIEDSLQMMLFVARSRSEKTLEVCCLPLPKRPFDEWLLEQSKGMNR